MRKLYRIFWAVALANTISFVLIIQIHAQSFTELESRRVSLPNGWSLTPIGKNIQAGDLPLNIAIAPGNDLAAVTNNGHGAHSIELIDLKKETIVQTMPIGKAWFGLSFSGDGKYLYASGGHDNIIIRYSVSKNHLSNYDTIRLGKPWPEKICIAGIAVDDAKQRLYAVTKENNSIYAIDLKTKKIISQVPLGAEGYTCILSPDHKTLYASCWGCDKIIFFDTEGLKINGSVQVGDNPNDMSITGNGQYLFVANANDDNISVLDTREMKVIEVLGTTLYPDSPGGSTPNSVCLSGDDKTLYIANADNNCLAVFDVSRPGSSKSKGFIPTGWYPDCVRIVKNKLLVANGKGLSSFANPYGPDPSRRGSEIFIREEGREVKMKVQYIGGLLKGTINFIDIPDEKQMAVYSKVVYNNTRFEKKDELNAEGAQGNPVPMKVGDKSPVKYIFYVIKENRTYDQVLGDMPEGNGDSKLTLFGEDITPNHHALAREFVLLDNFYCDGEVSADGHNWTMGAYAPDYMEKNWPTSYGGKGGAYPGEGAREMSNNKIFLWDICKSKGVTYRSYGEFVYNAKARVKSLDNHFCPYFNNSQAIRDTTRFGFWKRDFDSLMAINALPRFNTLRFLNDHTLGLRKGAATPFASVADNDLATGMFVDYLSHTPIWNESLIVIVEDDAQDGPDHVDAHRSIAFLAGGYVRRGYVDHTSYSTSSLLRTIELILGLPPMTQYDASATPLWRCFSNYPDNSPYHVKPVSTDLNQVNMAENIWQKKSELMDMTEVDRINDSEFNEIIWRAVKGLNSPCPPPVHAAFFRSSDEKD